MIKNSQENSLPHLRIDVETSGDKEKKAAVMERVLELMETQYQGIKLIEASDEINIVILRVAISSGDAGIQQLISFLQNRIKTIAPVSQIKTYQPESPKTKLTKH